MRLHGEASVKRGRLIPAWLNPILGAGVAFGSICVAQCWSLEGIAVISFLAGIASAYAIEVANEWSETR